MSYGDPERYPEDAQTEIKRLRAALYAIDYAIDDHGRALSFIEMLREKDAEIKRLRAALDAVDDHGRALSFIDILREKDAEIARLEEQLEAQNVRVAALRENRGEDIQLITEMAEALWEVNPDACAQKWICDLMQRARDAIKCAEEGEWAS